MEICKFNKIVISHISTISIYINLFIDFRNMHLSPAKNIKKASSSLNLRIWSRRMAGTRNQIRDCTCVDNQLMDEKCSIGAHTYNPRDWLKSIKYGTDDTIYKSSSHMECLHFSKWTSAIFRDSRREAQYGESRSAWALRYSWPRATSLCWHISRLQCLWFSPYEKN